MLHARRLLSKSILAASLKEQPELCKKFVATFGQVIKNSIDSSSEEFIENKNVNRDNNKQLDELVSTIQAGGGEKGLKRHVEQQKKVFVRDRIERIIDEGSEFFEVCQFAGQNMEYGTVANASTVAGIGRVHGLPCMFMANDATVKGGTMFPITVKKNLRVQEIAEQNRLPCIHLVDSGGAFLPLQADIFPDMFHGGRAFYNEAVQSAQHIPQIAMVCGNCTAGGAYVPMMCDEAVIVHRIGTIFLGGPPLVKAATGEVISAEKLGGATMHCEVSGCTDYFAADETEAFGLLRDIVATLGLEPVTRRDGEDPQRDPDDILGLIPVERTKPIDMMQVIAHVTDGSRFHEFKPRFGLNLICGFARINGHLCGVVANRAALGANEAVKSAHFLQLCDVRGLPVVFLQNTVGSNQLIHAADEDTQTLLGVELRAHAALLQILATLTIPKITIVAGHSSGVDSYLMCGRSMSPNFMFSWPNASLSICDQHTLQDHLQQAGADEKQVSVAMSKCSSMYTSSRVMDDGIIQPQNTRHVLSQCLDFVSAYPAADVKEVRPPIRM